MILEHCGSFLLQIVFLVILVAAYVYWKWKLSYWDKRGVPSINSKFPFGSVSPFSKKYLGIHFQEMYKKLKSAGQRHGGLYHFYHPMYMVVDPQLLRNILQTDFEHFTERGFYFNEKDEPINANILTFGGQRWRNLRKQLSPAFTSVKIKTTFPLLLQCANQMKNAIEVCCLNKQPIDTRETMACYTTDVIGSCAFGLDCNSFVNPNSPFRQYGEQTFSFASKFRIFKVMFSFNWPNVALRLGITLFGKDLSHFFVNIVKDTVKYRTSNNVIRKDMLQLLMELQSDTEYRNAQEKEKAVTALAAHVFLFFSAGFETSSSALTYCLYELACNPSIQKKLRDEIITVLSEHEGQMTFEAIMAMKYLGNVVDETLRKHPPVSFMHRLCEKDYQVPGTDLTLEKGIGVTIPIMALHHDPEYYPDPEIFDPERFSEENKKSRAPFTYMPFGEGPRLCIGFRFALVEIKVALATLLRNYKFSLHEKTEVPLKCEEFSFILIPKSQVLLNVQKC